MENLDTHLADVELSYDELIKQAYGLFNPSEAELKALGPKLAAARAKVESPTIPADEARMAALVTDETAALLQHHGFEPNRYQLFPA